MDFLSEIPDFPQVDAYLNKRREREARLAASLNMEPNRCCLAILANGNHHRNHFLTVFPRSPGSELVQQREEMTEEEMIAERKKKMKEIRKVMKEEEKLRQRDREASASASSCPPPQPLPVVPPVVKKEAHSPELSPPPQKRLERPEQCRAFPTSVICGPRSSREEERPEPQKVPSPRDPYPPHQASHNFPLNVERMEHGMTSQQYPILNPYQQQNPRTFPQTTTTTNVRGFPHPELPPRHPQDLSHLPSTRHHHPALQSVPFHQNLSSQHVAGRLQQQAPHHHYPPQMRAGYHPAAPRDMQSHPGLQRAMYPAPHSIPPPQTLPLSLAMPPLDPITTSRSQPLNEPSSHQGMKRSTVICQGGGRYSSTFNFSVSK